MARLMRRHGLAARRRRRYRVAPRAAHGAPATPDLLAQRFTVTGPNRVWVADITYVPTREGWLYLAAVIDLFARRVVVWATATTMTRRLVIDALQVALGQRAPKPGLIHQSDRGSQYASSDYQMLLARHGLRASMSAKGNCYDNAVAESFFHTLKTELVHRHRFATRREAHAHLFEYIEGFYNRQRRHSALGYATPAEFEKRHELR